MISRDFAGVGFLRREEEAAGELLGEGGAAAGFVLLEDVLDGALGGADVVDAAVLEEAAVFDGEDGLDHARGDAVVGDHAALGAVFVFREGGDELGFELVGGKRGAAVFGGDGLDDTCRGC